MSFPDSSVRDYGCCEFEIDIMKVLGVSNFSVATLLSKHFLKLVVLTNITEFYGSGHDAWCKKSHCDLIKLSHYYYTIRIVIYFFNWLTNKSANRCMCRAVVMSMTSPRLFILPFAP